MKVKKYTLLIDEGWEKEIIEKFLPTVETGEVFQMLDEEETEVCGDCQIFLIDSETHPVMEIYKCNNDQDYCLNCCGCDEHDDKERWYK